MSGEKGWITCWKKLLFFFRRHVLINGHATETISASDRGLHYGDGLFETLAVIGGVPCLWQRHMRRLCQGCDRLGMQRPDTHLLRDEAKREAGETSKGVLKIMLTRGSGGRGYMPPPSPGCSRLLQVFPWPDYPSNWAFEGVEARVCNSRLGRNETLAGIKHLGRLEQVLARAEWDDPEIAEGLMLDTEGRLIEGTMSNLFLRKGDRLYTPELNACGIAGVVRGLVMDLAAESGLTVRETTLFPKDIFQAEAAFLTNSVIGFWPVKRVQDHELGVPALPQAFSKHLLAKVYSH